MKYVRVTGTPDPAFAPDLFGVLADSPVVEETRLVDWNLTPADGATLLFEIDANAADLRTELDDVEEIGAVDVTAVHGTRCHLLLTLQPSTTPIIKHMFETLTRRGLVVLKPVVYRDGQAHARLVGDAAALQSALDRFPAAVEVTVHAIGEFHAPRSLASGSLTERQRATVEAALDVGYYEHPRSVTLEDVAGAMDCASSTVAEHLQKAEASLVRAWMGDV